MPSPTRTLLLGLDACDPELVRSLAGAGQMPNLAALLGTAEHLTFENELGYFVGSVWPTIMTGTTVARHQWYTGLRFDPATYTYADRPLTEPTLWERCQDAGLRVSVFDVPHVQVTGPVNGVQICEWGCHDRQFGTHSWPPALIAEMEGRHGVHPIGARPLWPDPRHPPCDHLHRAGRLRTADEAEALLGDLLAGVARKEAVSLDLLDRGGWDLFFTVFGEAHCTGHHLWHVHDESHHRHDPDLRRRLGDPLAAVYRRLDAAVGAHLERVAADTAVFVLLSHGMWAHHDGTHLLPQVLHRLSQAYDRGAVEGAGPRSRAVDAALSALPAAARAAAVRAAAPAIASRLAGAAGNEPDGPPPLPERTFFHVENNTVSGAIRLNLMGREGRGRIPAAERGRALRWLEHRLLELVNLDSGRPAVAAVHRSADHFGHGDDVLADLILEWDHERQIERVWSPATGAVTVPYRGLRTGDHRRPGVLLARGAGPAATGRAIGPHEIAGIVASTLGVEVPAVSSVPAPPAPRPQPARALDSGRAWVSHRRRRTAARRASLPGAPAFDRAELDGLLAAHHRTRELAEQGALAAEILATEALLHDIDVASLGGVTVSVVTATRNRRPLLLRAVESVRRQSWDDLEIVVVDDGSDDDTWDHLRAVEDPRVRPFRREGTGNANAARNRALDEAGGDLVVHLDDDNRFHADWLKAVVWAFERHPDRSVLYGARVVDDLARHGGGAAGGLPGLQLLHWDREAVRHANRVDLNVLAHRRTSTRFDETLQVMGDWDFVLQLSRDTEPLRLPVLATYYSTAAPHRMTDDRSLMESETRLVRSRWATG